MSIEISNQYLYTGRGPFDAKSIVKTYDDLLLETTWKSKTDNITAYNGMVVAVWLDKTDNDRNGVYYLYDKNVLTNPTAAYIVPAPDVTNPDNWHKIAGVSDLTALIEKLNLFEAKLEKLSDIELFKKIDSVKDLPDDFTAEDFNPNITYYTYEPATEKLITYVYVKSLPGYKCISTGDVSVSISKVEVNDDGELIVYYSNGSTSNLGSVIRRDETAISIKIGDTEYIADTSGVIDLYGVATIEYVDAKFVTKEELQKADYASKAHVADSIEDSFDQSTESLKTIVLYGGDADPIDDE